MVKFVHTSDWQLGMKRHFLQPESQGQFTGDRVNTIRMIGEVARRAGAEFIVVAGDVFETNRLPQRDIVQSLDAMREVGLPVYLLPGNHDVLGSSSIYDSPAYVEAEPDNVTVLRTPGRHIVREGVEILAAPWTSKTPDFDPVNGPVKKLLEDLPADGTVRIVLGHGMLQELEPNQLSIDAIDRRPLDKAISAGIIHYVALGDRHIRWPADDSGAIHYSGAHEVTDYREAQNGSSATDPGSVLIVDVSPKELNVTSERVGKWRFMRADFDLTNEQDVQALDRKLTDIENANTTIIKLVLTGALSTSAKLELDHVLERHEARFAALEYWDRHMNLQVLPDEDDFSELPQDGYLRRAVDELTENREDDAVAAEALMLLHKIMNEDAR